MGQNERSVSPAGVAVTLPESLLEHAPVPIAAVDLGGRQTYVNPAFARLVGWPAEALVGAQAPFVYWPEDELATIGDALQRTVKGEAPADGWELRFRHRDGHSLHVRVKVAPMLVDGAATGWVSSVLDISEARAAQQTLREQEHRLRMALDAGRLGAWEYDLATGRVHWSATLEQIHGIPVGSFGGDFEAYQRDIHPADRERVLSTIMQSMQGLQPHHLEYRIVRPDGETRWLEAHGRLFADANGTPLRMAGVCTDVTERRAAEDAVRSARDAADQANRAKSEFLAAMSHELRTPLNAIGGYVDLIDLELHGPVTEAQRTALERIRRNQQHLLHLINDVLHFARLDAGRLELDVRPFAVAGVLETIDAIIAPQAAARQLAYTFDVADDLWAVGDPERVEQVLVNLVANAVKYTPAGGRIVLRASSAADRICISVEDTGCGIPAESLGAIFDPFVQVQRTRYAAPQEQGVGLGLAISRELTAAMDGELAVQSTPGVGSTFTLRLPRCDRRDAASDAASRDAASRDAADTAAAGAAD